MGKPQHILITAGPTHEAIDEVRYLANRSSGRMGLALADAAARAGCEVTLLLGPASVEVTTEFPQITVKLFESTADLERLLHTHFPKCDVLIMAAAVADYRPASRLAGKLPRQDGRLVLELEPTPDLVADCSGRRRPGQRIIAFALEEPSRLADRAIEKLRKKGVDAIVANPLATMGSGNITAMVYTASGERFVPDPPTSDKAAFAEWLVRWILERSPIRE